MLTTIERNNKKYQVIEHYSIKINDLYYICDNRLSQSMYRNPYKIWESGGLYFTSLDDLIKFEECGTNSETKFIEVKIYKC